MRFRELVLSCLSWLACLTVTLGVGSLIAFLVVRGYSAIDARLFFGTTPAWDAILAIKPVWNGIWPAMAGTLSLLALTMLFVIVPGVSSGVYLACFASHREREYIGECVDVLAGIPSIVMGLFGLELIIVLRRTLFPTGTTCLLLAAFCLAILVLPTLITATRSSIEALPHHLTVTANALGMSKTQTVRHLLIPAAGSGILGGVILSMGRAMEDTAVIMLTGAVANAGLPAGLGAKFEALPFKIYYTAAQYTSQDELTRGFGTALLLLIMSWTVILTAKIFQKRMARRWQGGM
ncbi:MAG: ABC transporter permease subunit [Synergistaceae bacterium]|nr:ABC transporter permease subunit [Synergistaceae bacterium]MBR0094182.1 ABC transporter permease subunit [Synergistaceae bacterium]